MTVYLTTYTGRRIDVSNPKPEDIDVEDITHALAHTNRFNGHTSDPYSVAHHTLAMVTVLEARGSQADILGAALLHDMPEYVLGDMTSPVKVLCGGADTIYAALTVAWENAICEHFGWDGPSYRRCFERFVKPVDWEAYCAEATALTRIQDSTLRADKDMWDAVQAVIPLGPLTVKQQLIHQIRRTFG